MPAKLGDRIVVSFTGRLSTGTVFEKKDEDNPVTFVIGSGTFPSGFETAFIGMGPGECKSFVLSPENGYGVKSDKLIFEVDKSIFPESFILKSGYSNNLKLPDNKVIFVKIIEVKEKTVLVDTNHPLSGMTLTFEIKLLKN